MKSPRGGGKLSGVFDVIFIVISTKASYLHVVPLDSSESDLNKESTIFSEWASDWAILYSYFLLIVV